LISVMPSPYRHPASRDLCAVPQILAKMPSGVVPGEAGFAPLTTPKRSSSTNGLRGAKLGN